MAKLGTSVRAIVTAAGLAAATAVCGPVAGAPPPQWALPAPDGRVYPEPWITFQRIYRAAARADRAAGHIVCFDSEADVTSKDAIGAAAEAASDAIVALAARSGGPRLLARIDGVRIRVGPKAAVSVKDGVIVVAVNPSEGAAGRPSSLDIQYAAGLRRAYLIECHGAPLASRQ
jgi:hypothetical protein